MKDLTQDRIVQIVIGIIIAGVILVLACFGCLIIANVLVLYLLGTV